MADKIVILEDSEGNNIYPISRGLATNSVDTNAIQNGAVTSAKIDSTTLFQDISSQFTWSETGILANQAWLIASKFVLVNYMGGDTTHVPGQRIADIPLAYRPSSNIWEIANYAGVPGNVAITTGGAINCNSVGSQAQGRVLFSVIYPIS